MTTRENQLYELGRALGVAQGIEQATQYTDGALGVLRERAQQHREQFAKGLAALDTGPAAGPRSARARAKTIGERVLQRVARELHEVLG